MADEEGNTPIITAAGKGRTDAVKLLLEARGDPKVLNKHGQNAVFYAARHEDAELLKLLMEARCDPCRVDTHGFTAVMSAAATGNLDVLKMLLAARCDAESADTWMGFTPLFFATMGRKVDALDILLRARCDPHKRTSRAIFCESAALVAARFGKAEALKTLLRARSDPEAANISGDTAVMLAVREGHHEAVNLLLRERCDLTARNKDGDTAVSLAAATGAVNALRLLLEARCELDLRTGGDNTALDKASEVMDVQRRAVQWLLHPPAWADGEDVGLPALSSTEALALAYHRPKLAKQLREHAHVQQPKLQGQLRGLTALLPSTFRPSARDSSFIALTCGVPEVARSSGKLYHEVELLSSIEAAQLGWLTTQFDPGTSGWGFSPPKSVGADAEGWAFDAQRAAQWHDKRQTEANMARWRPDDWLGLAIDLDEGIMRISDRDGTWHEEAAYRMNFQKGDRSLYPAVSLDGHFRMHLDAAAWRHRPPSAKYQAWGTGIFEWVLEDARDELMDQSDDSSEESFPSGTKQRPVRHRDP